MIAWTIHSSTTYGVTVSVVLDLISTPDALVWRGALLAAAMLDGWLADVAPEQADAIRDVLAAAPPMRTALQSIAESSPYLFDLIRADAPRLLRLLRWLRADCWFSAAASANSVGIDPFAGAA